jgi:KDO2-lipid IV(A) lauroyltransferase
VPASSRGPRRPRRPRRRKSWWRRLRRATRRPRNAVLVAAIRGTGLVVGALPVSVGLGLGRGFGLAAHRVLGTPRRLALAHLGIAFPDWSMPRRQAVVRTMFQHAGASFAELSLWPRLRDGDYVHLDPRGAAVLDDALAGGRGAVVITGHVGNWELLAAAMAHRGYPVTVVARRVNDERFNALVASIRAGAGLRVVDRDDPRFVHILREDLARGRIVALLIDQDTRGAGVWVPFFGVPARTPPGAAVLALRARAPLVTAFIERRPEGGHLVRLQAVEDVEGRSRDRIVVLTARMTAAIEAQIRHNPAEWVWWHQRWRRRA